MSNQILLIQQQKMLEEFHSETPEFRLAFSSIKCQIKLQDLSILALAVKITKSYSQPTTKTELKNGSLQFPDSISIPVKEDLIYNNNLRKQKCELMLYRYFPKQKDKLTQVKDLTDSNATKKQKEKKNLIGMASLVINGQLFQEKVKTFRITNTFDKDATITCKVKISHDFFQSNQDRISSIGQISNASSTPKGHPPEKKPLNGILQMNQIQKQLNSRQIKPKVPDLRFSRMSEKNKPVSTKEMGSYSERHMVENRQENDLMKMEKMYSNQQQIFSGRIIKNDRHVQSYSQKYERKDSNRQQERQESQEIIQLCHKLQEQNNLLMNKIQNLQNHILNKSSSSQTSQVHQRKLNNSGSIVKAMIKKNNRFTTQASTSFTKVSDPKSVTSTNEKTQAKQTGYQSPKIFPNQSNLSLNPQKKMKSIVQIEFEDQSSKMISPKNLTTEKISFGIDRDQQLNFVDNNQVKEFPIEIDEIKTVPQVSPIKNNYMEVPQSYKFTGDKIEKQISYNQKSLQNFSNKYNEERNPIMQEQYKCIISQEIENRDYGLQNKNEKIPDITKLITTSSEIETQIFLNGNYGEANIEKPQSKHQQKQKQNQQKYNKNQQKQKQNQQKQKQRLEHIKTQRSTLQNVNQLIELKYRKTEKQLIISNQKLKKQNELLKKEKKLLESLIEQKKHLSVDQFRRLKTDSINHDMNVKYYHKMQVLKDEQIKNLKIKLQQAKEENENLQKNLRQQKKTAAYFIKTSHFQEQKQKQFLMKLKLIEQQIRIHYQLMNSESKNIKSPIPIPSLKDIYHSIKKSPRISTHHNFKRDQKGYMAQKVHNLSPSMSQQVPQLRLSITKISQTNRKTPSRVTPLSKAQKITEKQKSLESKGLSGLKKHSDFKSKPNHDLSQQASPFYNILDTKYEKANPKQNIFQNFGQIKNINTNF